MTSTGIVRRIDAAGRFVLPIELRRTLDIEDTDALEIFLEDNTIVLKKYQPACIFCGNARNVSGYKGKNVCENCRRDLGESVSLVQTKNRYPLDSGSFYLHLSRWWSRCGARTYG